MTIINLPDPSQNPRKPGIHYCEIRKVESKNSRAGDPMLNLEIYDIDTGVKLCHDTIMLGGAGWEIGENKLQAFGWVKGSKSVDSEALLFQRAYCFCVEEEYDGRMQLKIDIKKGRFKGYWPESEKPEGYAKQELKQAEFTDTEGVAINSPDSTPF